MRVIVVLLHKTSELPCRRRKNLIKDKVTKSDQASDKSFPLMSCCMSVRIGGTFTSINRFNVS